MRIEPFRLERYFAKHEFTTRYLLSSSDCESWSLGELLAMASPELREAWERQRFGYTDSLGHFGLRSRIAGLYESITPEQVLTAAPEEAIFILMHALLEAGDRVAVLTPAYQSLTAVARSIGCEVIAVPLAVADGGWSLDLDRLREAVTPSTRLLVVNFPHNPTGYLPTPETFAAIVDAARHSDAWLLCDEMYRLLEHEPTSRLPAAVDVYEKGVSLSGLSKSFGLPGLRVGWLAARDSALLDRCVGVKDYTTICGSAPSEALAMIALDASGLILRRNLDIVLRNRDAARACFAPPNYRWLQPAGGSTGFPMWTGPGSVEDFAAAMLAERQVLAVPGGLFGWPGSHFRVGLGRENLPEVLAQLVL
ncbi:MAG: aminotransferase class I/II-fold pyridoxal phosphate-dependent enzyme [Acidobacteria bacterium]|nr:aminotransferase class I/II-fold pyridoxal phosphate-dependent enzyme [Acidobacteriota bacterium]